MAEGGISVTTIFNAALIHLGEARRVLDADEDTPRAKILAERYPDIRDALLRSYKWNFIKTREVLTEDATPPKFGFAHRYRKPADCLKVWYVEGETDYPWKLEGDYIVTDIKAPLRIIYARREPDASKFDPVFRQILEMDLAIAVSPAIGNKRTIRVDLKQDRAVLIESGEFFDADEGIEDDLPEGSWLEARHA